MVIDCQPLQLFTYNRGKIIAPDRRDLIHAIAAAVL
jgi:hypothetical protein